MLFSRSSACFRLAVFGLGFAALASASGAVFTITPYNVLIFGSFSDTSDYGGLAAMGSLTISGTSAANSLLDESSSQLPGGYTLVSSGNLDATNGSLTTGNAHGGGSSNTLSLSVASGFSYTHSPAPNPLDFSTLQNSADNLAATLAAQTANASCVFDGHTTTTCTASAPGMNYITVTDPNILGSNRTVNIVLGSAHSYVAINVAGLTDTTTNFGVSINGGSVNGDSTTFSGSTEFHNFGFEGALPSTPEPVSSILIGAGLIGVSLIARRQSKRSAKAL